MPMNHRSGASHAQPYPRLIAAVAAIGLIAVAIFLLQPPRLHAAGASATVVSTAKTSLGRILVDSSGRTLYLFGKDAKGKSACSGKCAGYWPPLLTSGKPRAAGAAKPSLIGTTKRADGRLQVTYNHHPLYRFAQDTKKGQTHGEGIDAFGGHWYVVSPAGAAIKRAGGGY